REKAHTAIEKLKSAHPDSASISILSLELSSFESIKAAVKAFKASESRLDILINNAGIMMTAEGLTKEGYEIQFGTNHMGHTLFTQLLLPTLQETAKINPETRVISVASASESRAPIDIYKCDELKTMMADRHTTARYCISKIAQVHYNIAIAERYNDIKFICIHPGMVATNLHSESSGRFLKIFLNVAIASFATTVEKGALNQIWASVSPDARTGEFYGPVGAPGVGSRPCRNH
ncbi:hypothetical protein BGZ60DRAFT_329156, partial [Tricladium varicosporioides]